MWLSTGQVEGASVVAKRAPRGSRTRVQRDLNQPQHRLVITTMVSTTHNAYEQRREDKVRRNRAEMAMMVTASVPSKKRRRASDNQQQKRSGKGAGGVQQVRRSGRARKVVASYADDDKVFEMVVEEKNRSPRGQPTYSPPGGQPTYSPPDPEPDVEFVSARSLPDTSGRKRDANGCLVFDDEPDFRPNLSPQQMIASGIFGGCYFNPSGGKKGIKYPRGGIPIDHREYPDEWFCDLPASMYVSKRYDVSTNRYKVSRVVWFLWRRHVIDDSSLTLRLRRQQQQQQQRWKTGEGRPRPDVLGGEGVDQSPGPSRLVSVVHSVFSRQAHRGRPEADLKVEGGHGIEGPVEAIPAQQDRWGQRPPPRHLSVPGGQANAAALGTRAISPPFSHCPLADPSPLSHSNAREKGYEVTEEDLERHVKGR